MFDGDLVLVIDNETMIKGVDRNAEIVIDIEDKITALEEEDNIDNKIMVILRGMNSLIGETSNCATAYHNKTPKTVEQKEKYSSYIDLLSVINGKAIDSAKTGVIFNIPRNIAKFGRPLPYFMKYASEYYSGLHKFAKTNSNMNKLCYEIEKWEKSFRWKRTYKDFDYHIMIDEKIDEKIDNNLINAVEEIYLDFNREVKQLIKDQNSIRRYEHEDVLSGILTRREAKYFMINFQYYYNQYKNRCKEVCDDMRVISNIAVRLCYEKYPNKSKNFLWEVCGDGLVENIKKVDIYLPFRDDNGDKEYLGKRYRMEKLRKEDDLQID